MNRFHNSFVFLAIALILSGCLSQTSNQPTDQQQLRETPPQKDSSPDQSQQEPLGANANQSLATSNTEPTVETEISAYDIFTEEDTLSYLGFKMFKGKNKSTLVVEGKKYSQEVPYSILKKGKRIIKKFTSGDIDMMSAEFGLFNFLGGEDKQLLVGQTRSRNGRFWIVRLNPHFRILLDTDEYVNAREEPWVEDVDKDGIYEIKIITWDFLYTAGMIRPMTTAQPIIIFQYDRQTDKYLPANHVLQQFAPKGIAEEMKRLTREADESDDNHEMYRRDRVNLLLDYVFAGKREEGWQFFDKSYNLPDKQEVKAAIISVLRKHPVYRFIYRNRTKSQT
jgi:hypothetical protein